MSRELPSTCRWCDRRFAGNRKYCSQECRTAAASEIQPSDPSPEEIRAICRRIHEAGGPAWERNHTCYPVQRVQIRVVKASRCNLVAALD
jgi:hypothetical protein